jgi:hypothetical protein
MSFNIPILFQIINRLNIVEQVFEQIKNIKPGSMISLFSVPKLLI